jgi:hypothetical protein
MTDFVSIIIELLNIMAELLIIFIYFGKVFRYRYDSKAIYIIAYLSATIVMFAAELLSPKAIVLFSVTTALLLILAFTIYSERPEIKLFYVFIYLLIILIADSILMGIMYIMNLGSPTELLESGVGRIIGMIGTKVLYIWMVLIVSKVLMKKVCELPFKYWVSIILMPIISIVILYSIFISIIIAENKYSMMIYIASIVGIVYINVAMFNFFDSYSNQIKLAFMKSVAEREAENYRSLKISYQEMKKLKHDFQNELQILNDMIENHKYENAEIHIAELSRFINKTAAVCYTGNEAVDSLINIKINIARQYNIQFLVKMKLYTELNVNPIELCRIIGNALDNAIEACCRIDESSRFICVSFKEVDEHILLEISNSSDYVDTDNLATTKSDKHLHGYGIQSIYSSAKRIGGDINFKYWEGVFTLKLLLYNMADRKNDDRIAFSQHKTDS